MSLHISFAFNAGLRAMLNQSSVIIPVLVAASLLPLPAQGTIPFTANPAPQTSAPQGLQGHALGVRSDGSMVLFGGAQATRLLSGTYTSTSGTWTRRISILNPTERSEATLAFDSVRNETVLFGGKDTFGSALSDTWTFANNQWTYRPTANSPQARHGHAVAFDAHSGVVVLFGGMDATQGLLSDTWLWNGASWQQASPAHSPSARTEHAMAYDQYRRRIVLFGGQAQSGMRNDVNEWDGANWVAVQLAVNNRVSWAPSPRSQHAMGYDPVSERVVVHAGQVEGGAVVADTWSWDGTAWVQLLASSNAPVYRKNAAMGRDALTQRLLPFGGAVGESLFADASELVVPVLSRLREYGAPCVGSAGPLELRLVANAQASLGTTLQVQMTGLALPFSVGVGFVGLSDQLVGDIPLPVDLALVGIPGCNAYNSADIQFPLGVPSGSPLVTQWGLAIPDNICFLGLDIHIQALALEGFGFSRFATVTNGIAARIGNAVTVTPAPPPVASFNVVPPFGALPLVVQFTDTSTGGVGVWQWDFDNDGVVDSTLQNPTHTYTAAGQYSVRLTVGNFGGSTSLLRSNVIDTGFAPNPLLNMVAIQAGTFQMGSASIGGTSVPVHSVTITRPFWMGKYEVTQAEYQAVMGNNPSFWRAPQRPVETVPQFSAMAYCAALTTAEAAAGRIPDGYQYRLPTEAEWEYVCRAGTTTEWSTGASLSTSQANFNNPSSGQTTVIGSYAANPWGLFDMHGNVWEWCLDSWDGSANYTSSAVSDPFVPGVSGRYVFRGGGWRETADGCRSALRAGNIFGSTFNSVGFRVVLAPVRFP
jgi:formylglycine-generating enzyme required for sulfatase activity